MTRDFVGYGPQPPHAQWPGDARIAVNFVINFEEGSELSYPNGDGTSEGGLTEMLGADLGVRGRDVWTSHAAGTVRRPSRSTAPSVTRTLGSDVPRGRSSRWTFGCSSWSRKPYPSCRPDTSVREVTRSVAGSICF